LGIFLKKALEFITYYKRLKLIEENKKIVLIYLYNNNITYNYKEESKIIMNEYKSIKSESNIKLYIAFMQPYIKIMNVYKQSKKLRDLKQEFEEKNKVLKEDFEKKNKELEEQNKVLKEDFEKKNKELEEKYENIKTRNKNLEELFENQKVTNQKLENEIENLKLLINDKYNNKIKEKEEEKVEDKK
jgi:hypothetical protein